jgi:isocitrate dehydrogenase
VFLDWDEDGRDPVALAGRLASAGSPALELRMITNRGVKVWPAGLPETFRTDHWRCRFLRRDPGRPLRHAELQSLLAAISGAGLDYVKTEHLHEFDGVPGYSSGQGE